MLFKNIHFILVRPQLGENLAEFAKINNLSDLSMGMSNDYECAIKNGATFVRIGSKIFEGD